MRIQDIPQSAKALMATAKIPVQFEEGLKALAACRSIDEAKYWASAAEALAAWARIHKEKRAGVEAKLIDLHAHRRMGELAAEMRPIRYRLGKGGKNSPPNKLPGPVSL